MITDDDMHELVSHINVSQPHIQWWVALPPVAAAIARHAGDLTRSLGALRTIVIEVERSTELCCPQLSSTCVLRTPFDWIAVILSVPGN